MDGHYSPNVPKINLQNIYKEVLTQDKHSGQLLSQISLLY